MFEVGSSETVVEGKKTQVSVLLRQSMQETLLNLIISNIVTHID